MSKKIDYKAIEKEIEKKTVQLTDLKREIIELEEELEK